MTTKESNHMNRFIALVTAIASVTIVAIIYLAPRAETPTFVSPLFKECRTTAFEHHVQCLNWYSKREAACAEALKNEVKICEDVFPPVLTSSNKS